MSEEHAETGHRAVGNGVTAGAVVSVYQSVWRAEMGRCGGYRSGGCCVVDLSAQAGVDGDDRRCRVGGGTGDAGLSSLPPETYRQPVVLVCGGLSAHLFTDSPVRQVSEGLYLHVPDEEQLVAQVERLLTLRPAWASQLAVAYTIMPGIHRDVAVLAGRLRRFAHSMATVRRRAGVNVPWLLWSGLSGSPLPERASSPWFICTGGEVQVATSTENAMPAQWIAQSGVQERSQRLSYLLKAESLMQWLDLNVLAELNGPEAKCPPLAMAVGLVPSLPAVDNNLWQFWITARTGLTPDIAETPDIADTGTDDALPFPDALFRRLPCYGGCRVSRALPRCDGPA